MRKQSIQRHWKDSAFLIAVMIIGFLIRFLAAANTRIWIDEALSWSLVQNADSLFDLFRIPWDNNHVVNSFFMYLAGDTRSELLLRLHAVIFGTLAILAAWVAARPWGKASQRIATLLVSISFVPVLYGSEARGYASLIPLALLAYILLRRSFVRPSFYGAIAFFFVCVFGFLSHLSFGILFLSACMWILHDVLREKFALSHALALTVPTTLFLSLISLTPIVPPEIAGRGINDTPYYLLREYLVMHFGFPEHFLFAILSIILLLMFFVYGVQLLRRSVFSGERIFFCTLFACNALGFLIGVSRGLWGVRYGLLGVLFFILVLARFLPKIATCRKYGTNIMVTALILLGTINIWQDYKLITVGRGWPLEAFTYIAENTDGKDVTVTSRNISIPLQLQFYEKKIQKQVTFLEPADPEWRMQIDFRVAGSDRYLRESRQGEQAEWYIIADKRHLFNPGDGYFLSPEGMQYRFERIFRYHAVSGYEWFVYRRIRR